jgi:long-chain acyl-CoA synthetase
MRLEHVLAAHAIRKPHKTAVVCNDRRQDYQQLNESVLRTAAGLANLGVGLGDRVLLYLRNGLEFVHCLYGCMVVGGIGVPVNTRLTANEIAYFVADAQPKVIVYDAVNRSVVDSFADRLQGTRRIVVGDAQAGESSFHEVIATPPRPPPRLPCDATDCMIMYTSGTTGTPKGVIVTHANILVQHGYLNAITWGIGADDVYLITTPLAHRTGQGRLGNAMCLGGTLVIMEKFEAGSTVDRIEAERVTVVGMVPTIARMLLPEIARDPTRCASLRRIIVTGEAFPMDVQRQLLHLLPNVRLLSFFAMSEVGLVTLLDHEEQFTHPTSLGRPVPGFEVRIVNDQGEDLPVGAVGEMLVRTGVPGTFTAMRGYFNRPEENAAAVHDGWIRTGDLVRADQDGYLYLVDRKKDMIVSGGYNVFSKEVEQALASHPAVADAGVIGVPDELFGQSVMAFVEKKSGTQVTAEELVEHCRRLIASYKKPKHLIFVDTLPRNSLGKTLKVELRKIAETMINA